MHAHTRVVLCILHLLCVCVGLLHVSEARDSALVRGLADWCRRLETLQFVTYSLRKQFQLDSLSQPLCFEVSTTSSLAGADLD